MVADEFIFTGELGRHKENRGHKCFFETTNLHVGLR